ncbi:MAG: T9SS type A sorting domain-containing protein, partial [Calditrichia bacterium]
ASNWSAISGDLSNGPYPGGLQYGTITTMAVAPSNSNVIYAGTDDGNVWVTMNGGMDWNNISAQLPLRWVMSIAVDPFDENKAVATLSGYKYGQYIGHVFRTNNAGQTWVDISANVRQAPVNKIVIDPDYPDIFYVGTDVGVYVTSNAGVSWNMLGENLPAAVVMDLTLHSPTRTLVAATHGRSMFKIDVSTVVNISAGDEKHPREFRLKGVYPNPFNSETVVEFQLEKPFLVDVTIFDLLGRSVKVLNRKTLAPGNYKIRWDGINSRGLAAASGNYLVRVVAGPHQATRLISLVK